MPGLSDRRSNKVPEVTADATREASAESVTVPAEALTPCFFNKIWKNLIARLPHWKNRYYKTLEKANQRLKITYVVQYNFIRLFIAEFAQYKFYIKV